MYVGMTNKRVVVTGLGLVSPVGCVLHDAWDKVLSGVSCVTKLDDAGVQSLPSRVAGVVPLGNNKNELHISTYIPDNKLRTMSLAACYALIAAKKALSDANWLPIDNASKEKTGVAVGMGMVDFNDIYQAQNMLNKSYNSVSPYFIPRILPNMAASQIGIEYGFQGPNHSVSTACATGCHAIGDSYNMIKNNLANVMICGGTEACINPLSIAGFCRLRALSTSFNDNPGKASRPFDKKRDGFVIAEGAAILVLEEMVHALEREAKIYAEIKGYGLSGDGAHLTAPLESGKGAILAMKKAIDDAGVSLADITYINAHATSTPLGDAIELNAIKTLFGVHSKNLIISSTKGVHGHLLGAAGSLESLFTVLACYYSKLPPTANLEESCDESSSLNCISQSEDWNTSNKIALKNSFGFGGTNACVCISEFKEDTV